MAQKVFIDSDTLVELTDLKFAYDDAAINDATIVMSLFEDPELHPDCSEIAYTHGGVAEPAVGDVLIGATGGATGEIKAITLETGTWAGGDAAGIISFIKQFGTFQAENLDQFEGQANICAIGAATSGVINDAGNAKIHIRNHDLTTNDFVRIQGMEEYNGEYDILTAINNYVTIDKAFGTAIKLSGDEVIFKGIRNGKGISMTHGGGDPDGYYNGILPDTLLGLVNDANYWRIITITKTGTVITIRQRCIAAYYLDID